MAITDRNGLIAALPRALNIVVNKGSIANTVAGQFFSLWLATGTPGAGAIPGAAAVCNSVLAGAFPLVVPTGDSYIGWSSLIPSTAVGAGFAVFDRLAHMGGLSGTVATAQTASVDVSGATNNLVQRIGQSNYSEVQWFLEWYTDTGATSVNATVAVTYDDASTANIVLTAIGATVRSGRMLPIVSTTVGRYIKSVQTVTLSASTLTAGSFGVTAARQLTQSVSDVVSKAIVQDWAGLGLPEVFDNACLFLVSMVSTTSTGTVIGIVKIPQG